MSNGVHCRICESQIGYMGWSKHVRMHKKAVEKLIQHWPTWNEVLEVYGLITRDSGFKFINLSNFEEPDHHLDVHGGLD